MKDNKIPSPLVSLLPVFVLILLLFVTIRTFGSDALSGGSQVCLLVATAVCVLIGMAGFRRPWKDFELAVTNNIAGVSTALIILLIIGALSGAWMVSGVVPTLIYYGIQVIHPHFFLVSTCIICAVVSVIAEYTRILSDKFHISWWLMIVPVVTAILIARKVPSIITLFVSTALATVFALIFQPGLLCEIAGQGVEGIAALFKGGMGMLYGGTQLETGNAEINELISTRGMAGMMNTIWLIICAMCFGGAMTAGGMLGSITSVFVRFTKKRVGMVSSTVASGLFLNLATADQYISIILTGNMFKDIYSANGYESKLLSRTTEDSVTVTSPLIPWNTCGMTQATILSVPTIVYLPYAFFNIISPLMSITIAILGYKIKKKAEQSDLS